MTMAKDTIQINFPDVRLQITCAHPPLLEHIQKHLEPVIARNPEPPAVVEVDVLWREGDQISSSLLPLADRPEARKIGKRLYRLNDADLLWTDLIRTKNMALLYHREPGKVRFTFEYYLTLPAKKLKANPHYRNEKYFSLLKYFVYFPFMWYSELFLKRFPLHASGIVFGGRGMALGGVGGVGKTTTSIALFSRNGARFLSENIVLFDESRFYSMYEPIRLDARSVELLGGGSIGGLYPADLPEGTRAKNLFHIQPAALLPGADAGMILLPDFYRQAETKRLTVAEAWSNLHNFNILTREINDYYWFAAAANLLSPEVLVPDERLRGLKRLAEKVPVYHLSIDRKEGVAPLTDRILNLKEKQ